MVRLRQRLLMVRCAASRPSASRRSTASAAAADERVRVLVRLEVREQIVGEGSTIAAAGPPHADTQPHEVGGGKLLRDRTEAVVSGEAAAAAGLQAAELEIALVVHDEDRVRLELEEPCRGLHRAAGVVHERLGFEQRDFVPVDPDLGEAALELAAPGAVMPPRKLVDDEPTDVVAVPCVLAPRVTEADHEQVERSALSPRPEPHQRFSRPGIVMLRDARTKSGKDAGLVRWGSIGRDRGRSMAQVIAALSARGPAGRAARYSRRRRRPQPRARPATRLLRRPLQPLRPRRRPRRSRALPRFSAV